MSTVRIWDSELEFELIEFVLRKQMQQYKSYDKKVQKNHSKTAKLKKKVTRQAVKVVKKNKIKNKNKVRTLLTSK